MRFTILVVTAALVGLGAISVAYADGARIYKSNCAKCHGAAGQADSAGAKAMKAPVLARNAKVAAMSEADLATAISTNKRHVALFKPLSADDLAAVTTFTKGLAGGK